MSKTQSKLDPSDLDRFAAAVRKEQAARTALLAAKKYHAEAAAELAVIRAELNGEPLPPKNKGRPKDMADILDLLSNGEPWSTPQLMESTGRSRASVVNHLSRMVSEGTLMRVGTGKYELPSNVKSPASSPVEEDPNSDTLSAATPDEILELMNRHAIEWSASEFTDFLDVDPESVGPVLQQLLEAGKIRKVRKKFIVID